MLLFGKILAVVLEEMQEQVKSKIAVCGDAHSLLCQSKIAVCGHALSLLCQSKIAVCGHALSLLCYLVEF